MPVLNSFSGDEERDESMDGTLMPAPQNRSGGETGSQENITFL